MRLTMIVAAAFCSLAFSSGAGAQETTAPSQDASSREQPRFCTHATSRSGYGCPSLRAGSHWRIARFQAEREEREFRAEIDAALAEGRCDEAREIAVNKGRHELAARIRKACAAAS